MNPTEIPVIVTLPTVAAANLTVGRFVTPAGAVPAAGAVCAGVVHEDVDLGDPVPVVINGLVLVTAGGSIALGAEVETDNQGRAITLNTGKRLGIALSASTGAGQPITLLLK